MQNYIIKYITQEIQAIKEQNLHFNDFKRTKHRRAFLRIFD